MYITAGLGSQSHGERFTVDYDLPPATAYTESCASVGLVFQAWRLSLIDRSAEYADITEQAIYKGVLSGASLNGKRYFYVNPLEIVPEKPATGRIIIMWKHIESNGLTVPAVPRILPCLWLRIKQ